MRILHTSDWHVGRRMRGRDRSEEHRRVLAEIVDVAARHRAEMTVVSGDLFDSGSPTPVAEEIVWKGLLDLAELGPVVIVAGNHDNPIRVDALAPILENSRVHALGAPRAPDRGGSLLLEGLGVRVALLPFVSQRAIVRAEDIMGSDPDQHAGKYEDRVRRVVGRLTDHMEADTVNILAGHLTVYGATAGGGEREAHIFGYAVPASVFPGHLSYVALGHLHRQQRVPHPGAVWYSGSPMQLDFGEVDDRKGVLLVEAAAGQPSRVTEVPITTGRRLASLRGTLDEVLARADDVGDAYVKVVLTEPARVGLADEVRSAIPDAVEVTLARPDPGGPRVPFAPRKSLDPKDAFARYLDDCDVNDPAVRTLFAELLGEVEP